MLKRINSSAFRLEVFKWRAKNLFILNYSSSAGDEKYSPILGSSSILWNPVFSKNISVVVYRIGFPGTSSSPDFCTNPRDSRVLIDDSDIPNYYNNLGFKMSNGFVNCLFCKFNKNGYYKKLNQKKYRKNISNAKIYPLWIQEIKW